MADRQAGISHRKTALRRIGIVGPESAGKTTMARALAAWYGCFWVPEYAREYLHAVDREAQEDDLLPIAQAQRKQEQALATRAGQCGHRLLICDTTQLVMYIWAEYQYGRTHPWILQAWQSESYHMQLLCAPDIAWEADPLRGLPDLRARQKVFAMYESTLRERGCHYVVLRGKHFARLQQATAAIARTL